MTERTVLEDATNLIDGNRKQDYGDWSENGQRIADFWSTYLGIQIDPEDVAVLMMLLKIARLANGVHHYDTWVDIAGYVGLGAPSEEMRKAFAPLDLIKTKDTGEHPGAIRALQDIARRVNGDCTHQSRYFLPEDEVNWRCPDCGVEGSV